jgi:hypothetical protein
MRGAQWHHLRIFRPENAAFLFPAFDCFRAPDQQTFAFKGLWECNWLQALEVGIDPAHASFLHRFLEDESVEAAYGRQFRSAHNQWLQALPAVLARTQ